MKRPLVSALLALSLLAACDADPSPKGPAPTASVSATATATATAPPLTGLERLPEIRVVSARGDAGEVVTQIRALVPTVTTKDALRVLVDWRDAGGAPIAAIEEASLAEIRVTVVAPDGPPQDLVAAATKPLAGSGKTWPLLAQELHLDAEGIRIARHRNHLRWTSPPSTWLAEPGAYRVVLSGVLHAEDGDAGRREIPWKSGELTFTVRAASDAFAPLGAIEKAAAEHLRERRGMASAPHRGKATLEDAAGNRLVRFTLQEGHYDVHFVEVVVEPDGTVVHEREEKVFTCVAEGTAILTPDGRRPIETLRPGDEVVGYDVEGGRRVVTRVVDNLRSWADETLELSDTLRVTPQHPVYVMDRGFVAAGRVASGRLWGPSGPLGSVVAKPSAGGVVFDLAVDWPHTYFAAGVLVHNKAAPTTRGRQVRRDSWSDVDIRPKPKR